jgi:hypothetical protein
MCGGDEVLYLLYDTVSKRVFVDVETVRYEESAVPQIHAHADPSVSAQGQAPAPQDDAQQWSGVADPRLTLPLRDDAQR